MKSSIMLLAAVILCSSGVALASTSNLSSTLGSAWKTEQLTNFKKDKNIDMVYGGEDISRKPTLILHTATA